MKINMENLSKNKILDKDSGLVLNHYKEPLVKVKNAFGYMGALLITSDGEKVQCHICGKLFKSLSMHIYNGHNMMVRKYREKFQLAFTTSLISESERQRMKAVSMRWWDSLTTEEKKKFYKRRDKFYKRSKGTLGLKHQLETKNKRGTCPDQLIQKILDVKEELKRVPSLKDFMRVTGGQRFKRAILATFGTWTDAVKKAGLTPLGKPYKVYSDEELLQFLKDYYKINKKIPTSSDGKRGLIPKGNVYQLHFGGMVRARELAGIPNGDLRKHSNFR